MFWALIIASFGWTTFVMIMGANAIAGESMTRVNEYKETQNKIAIVCEKQQDTNEQTTKVLERILTKLDYIEKAVASENNGRNQ
jgi:riboflavin synthase alpha subunit